MTSRPDLIKAILRNSNDYTMEQLSLMTDDELVFLKLKTESKSARLNRSAFEKQIVVGSSRSRGKTSGWKKKKHK